MAKMQSFLIPILVFCCLLGIFLSRDLLLGPPDIQNGNQEPTESAVESLRTELQFTKRSLKDLEATKEDLEEKLKKAIQEAQDLRTELDNQNKETECQTEEQKISSVEQNLVQEEKYHRRPSQRNIICSHIAQATNSTAIPNTAYLWTLLLNTIHQASHLLPNDPKFAFHDFTAHLLQVVSSQLPRTVQTLPRRWESVDAILDIGWKRYRYLKDHPDMQQDDSEQQGKVDNDNNIPRPVKIVVLGGSLLQGTNCRKLIRDLNMPQVSLSLRECSWGHRLKKFINKFFQVHLVEVTTIGVGGTNSETGSLLLQNGLLPPETSSPDIIINAYSTNDMHAWTMEQASQGNTTLGDQVRGIVQDFVRNATLLRHEKFCKEQQSEIAEAVAPLVLHFEDYIGNEQREIIDTMEGALNVHMLAQYYGFASMSYAELVRGWVYGDTHETWFSPEGWYGKNSQEMTREIHPQMPMHMVAVWVVAYNLLNIAITYCSIEPWRQVLDSSKNTLSIQDDILQVPYETSRYSLPQLPVLRGDTQYIPKGKPKSPPKGLPPRLSKSLSLETISNDWREETRKLEEQQKQKAICSNDVKDASEKLKCPFAWVSRIRVVPLRGVEETENRDDQKAAGAYWKAHAITDFDSPRSAWKFQSDHGKMGIVPDGNIGAELLLEVPAQQLISRHAQPLRTVTLFYMKSYGATWADSKAKVEVLSPVEPDWDGKVLESLELLGYHSKNTSETYTDTIHLSSQTDLRQLRIRITLISGSTFKIMGLLACR